jgi:signal transduction histidine kinase
MMARMVSNRLVLDVESLDPRAVVEAAIESVRPMAAEKHLFLRQMFDPAAGPVKGDRMRLQQVIVNLLTNAVKFTPEGGRIDVSLQRSGSWVTVSVADNGMGIAPALLPHVFERYRQHPKAARSHGGVGLGLAIARQLARLHGGDIDAHSDGEGRGATFTLKLPAAAA